MTAVIPVWNRRDLLPGIFATLTAQTRPPAEILVIDDGSTDGAAEEAERLGARVVRMGRNGGFAAAVNRGIRECRTALLAVVNNDVDLAPDYLERLGRAAVEPGIWFATGKILSARDPTRLDGAFDLVAASACAWRAGHGCRDCAAFAKPRRIWSAPATAAVYHRELFQRIGLFDELFGSYLEDVDLGLRCAAAGLGGWYEPGAVAYHQGSATLGKWSAETTRRISRNQVLLARRYFGFTWRVAAGQALWGLLAARHGRFVPWLRGKMDGLGARTGTAGSPFPGQDAEIRQLQLESGQDLYWKWYFALT
jgi:GT2 family glycosyltransferase